MRRLLKALSLVLLIGGPLWGVVSVILAVTLHGGPQNATEIGRVLDVLADQLVPTLLSGGVLWLLVSIDERLERQALERQS